MTAGELRSQLADRRDDEPVFVVVDGERDTPREIVGLDFDSRLTGSDATLIVAESERVNISITITSSQMNDDEIRAAFSRGFAAAEARR